MMNEIIYNGYKYKRIGRYIYTNKTISNKILFDLGYEIIDNDLFVECTDMYINNNFDNLYILIKRKEKLKKI